MSLSRAPERFAIARCRPRRNGGDVTRNTVSGITVGQLPPPVSLRLAQMRICQYRHSTAPLLANGYPDANGFRRFQFSSPSYPK